MLIICGRVINVSKQEVNPDKKIKLWKTSNVIIILLKNAQTDQKKITL